MGLRTEAKESDPKVPHRRAPAMEGTDDRAAGPSLKGIHVLLVDDEEDALEMLALTLRQHGARVTTTMSAAEAFAAFEHRPPDVLVSDIAMPGEDGYSLINRIRRLPPARGGKVPAVALTAFAAPDQRVNALLAGYHIHLPKPIEAAELLRVISGLGRRGRH